MNRRRFLTASLTAASAATLGLRLGGAEASGFQFDFYRDMPGGLKGLRVVADELHAAGVKNITMGQVINPCGYPVTRRARSRRVRVFQRNQLFRME